MRQNLLGVGGFAVGGSSPDNRQHGRSSGENKPELGLQIPCGSVESPSSTSWFSGPTSGSDRAASNGSDKPHTVGPEIGGQRPKMHLPRCSQPPRPSPQPDVAENRTFACHYYKLESEMYSDCRFYKLRRFKDVQQHIKRIHTKQLFCTRCHAVFDSLSPLQAHEKKIPPCEWRERPALGFISSYHFEKFGESKESGVGRSKSQEEQWMDLWDFLFPGVDRPWSAYLESQRGEMTYQVYKFWLEHKEEIDSEVYKDDPFAATSQSMMAYRLEVVGRHLQHLLMRFGEGGVPTSQDSTPPPPSEISSQSSTICESEISPHEYDTSKVYSLTTQDTAVDIRPPLDATLPEPNVGIIADHNWGQPFPAGFCNASSWDAHFRSPSGCICPSDLLVSPDIGTGDFARMGDFGSGDDPPWQATRMDPPPVIDLKGFD